MILKCTIYMASSSLREKLWVRCQYTNVDMFRPYVGHLEVTDIIELDLTWTLVLFLFFAIAKHKCQNHHLGNTAVVRKSRRLHCLPFLILTNLFLKCWWKIQIAVCQKQFKLYFHKSLCSSQEKIIFVMKVIIRDKFFNWIYG